jgi:ABC-type multidrug transport system ATPase subunit
MLTIRGLTKIYPGPVAALQGIDLDIPTGMFGLLGPNGAGKTTLMRILAGLLEPTSGTVTLGGKDVLSHPETLWAQLGYLPQEFGFYPHLTGGGDAAPPAGAQGRERRAGIEEARLRAARAREPHLSPRTAR